MSVKIRLKRMGATKRPFYRIVVADSRSPRDGRFIETLGYYNPCVEPVVLKIDPDRTKHWLSVGAQPTDTASALLKKEGLVERTTKVVSKKTVPAQAGE
jgi:small subunit ribosomal protein S16